MSNSATPWPAARQASLSISNSRSFLKLMSIKLVIPSNHFILCHPLLLLLSIFPSIRVFSNESVLCIRCPKYWSFSFSISPSNEYSGQISCRIDWFDLLAVQGDTVGCSYLEAVLQLLPQDIVFVLWKDRPKSIQSEEHWKNSDLQQCQEDNKCIASFARTIFCVRGPHLGKAWDNDYFWPTIRHQQPNTGCFCFTSCGE